MCIFYDADLPRPGMDHNEILIATCHKETESTTLSINSEKLELYRLIDNNLFDIHMDLCGVTYNYVG